MDTCLNIKVEPEDLDLLILNEDYYIKPSKIACVKPCIDMSDIFVSTSECETKEASYILKRKASVDSNDKNCVEKNSIRDSHDEKKTQVELNYRDQKSIYSQKLNLNDKFLVSLSKQSEILTESCPNKVDKSENTRLVLNNCQSEMLKIASETKTSLTSKIPVKSQEKMTLVSSVCPSAVNNFKEDESVRKEIKVIPYDANQSLADPRIEKRKKRSCFYFQALIGQLVEIKANKKSKNEKENTVKIITSYLEGCLSKFIDNTVDRGLQIMYDLRKLVRVYIDFRNIKLTESFVLKLHEILNIITHGSLLGSLACLDDLFCIEPSSNKKTYKTDPRLNRIKHATNYHGSMKTLKYVIDERPIGIIDSACTISSPNDDNNNCQLKKSNHVSEHITDAVNLNIKKENVDIGSLVDGVLADILQPNSDPIETQDDEIQIVYFSSGLNHTPKSTVAIKQEQSGCTNDASATKLHSEGTFCESVSSNKDKKASLEREKQEVLRKIDAYFGQRQIIEKLGEMSKERFKKNVNSRSCHAFRHEAHKSHYGRSRKSSRLRSPSENETRHSAFLYSLERTAHKSNERAVSREIRRYYNDDLRSQYENRNHSTRNNDLYEERSYNNHYRYDRPESKRSKISY